MSRSRWQASWLMFLLPVLFLAVTAPFWIRLHRTWNPIVAIQLEGEISPVEEISLYNIAIGTLAMFAVLITFACWVVVRLNRERRSFWNIIQKMNPETKDT